MRAICKMSYPYLCRAEGIGDLRPCPAMLVSLYSTGLSQDGGDRTRLNLVKEYGPSAAGYALPLPINDVPNDYGHGPYDVRAQ